MKINEIFDTEFRNTKFPGSHKGRPMDDDDEEEPDINTFQPPSDSGMFGIVKPMPRNPHEVYKTTKYSFDETDPEYEDEYGNYNYDGYYAWVTAIAPYAKSNPYLPRVYVIDKKTDENDLIRPRYQMEKLLNYNEVQFSVLRALFMKEVPDATDEMFDELKHGDHYQSNKKLIWMHIIAGVFDTANDYPGTNPQVDELVELIDQVSNGNEPDTENVDNAMIRQTSKGPQIVFTDPVSAV